jgi:hypothetical protein
MSDEKPKKKRKSASSWIVPPGRNQEEYTCTKCGSTACLPIAIRHGTSCPTFGYFRTHARIAHLLRDHSIRRGSDLAKQSVEWIYGIDAPLRLFGEGRCFKIGRTKHLAKRLRKLDGRLHWLVLVPAGTQFGYRSYIRARAGCSLEALTQYLCGSNCVGNLREWFSKTSWMQDLYLRLGTTFPPDRAIRFAQRYATHIL